MPISFFTNISWEIVISFTLTNIFSIFSIDLKYNKVNVSIDYKIDWIKTETMLCYVSNSSEEILYIWKPQIKTSASMLHVYAAIYNSHGYFGMDEWIA